MKNPDQYYLKMLQLYMPWRNEDKIKGDCHTYEEKYNQVEPMIKPNIYKHDPYFGIHDIDLNDLLDNYVVSESESDEDNDDFGMLNPDLLDLDMEEDNDENNVPVASTTVESRSLLPEQYYEMCSQLNELQQHLLNFIMKFAVKCRYS